MLNYLKSVFQDKKKVKTAPSGYCPNCWGRQSYSGQFYDAVKMEGITTNNIDSKKGWVQSYVEKNLSGIQLAESDAQLVCNNCKVHYKNT